MMHWFRRSTYAVSEREDWMTPEETLVDSSSAMADIEVPVSDTLFRSGIVISCCVVGVLLLATGWLAVGQNQVLAQMSERNRTVNVSVPPPRGIIMDRRGVPLVQNVPSFDLLVIGRQVRRLSDGSYPDIARVANALTRDASEVALAISEGIRSSAVFFLATDMPREQVLALQNILPQGFSIITSTKRSYTDGSLWSHLVGYVGKVSKRDMAADAYYLPTDTVGRLGIESQYEGVLRGAHGQLTFATGGGATSAPATAGGNMVLTSDADIQQHLSDAVGAMLREAGLSEGAAVVQDPRDGSILGLVSFPSYDSNMFTSGRLSTEAYATLFENPKRPMFNRVIAGRYNPGSTIKPFIGLTAMQENIVSATDVVNRDCVSISVPNPTSPDHPYVFGNWRADTGPFDLTRAIADSCNVYFYTVGGGYGQFAGLGMGRIISYLTKSFADSLLGIDIPGEEHGFVPTPEWKRATKKEPWYQGDTYNTSIGQGDLLVTPLWLNTFISAVANGGTLWTPRVAQRVVDNQNVTLALYAPQQLGALPYGPNVIKSMQRAMRATVTDGTAHMLANLPVSVAAKTGTAEVVKGRRINSLLTLWAPAENPEISMTVLIEGSESNQGYALRVAQQFLTWYFGQRSASPTPFSSPSPTP